MNKPVKYYLGAYNLVAFIFWAAYLITYIASGFELNIYNLLLLNIAQGLAVLEIFHALFKWVKSPVLSTIAQVTSRILVVVVVDLLFISWFCTIQNPPVYGKAGIIIVSFAWSITELVRYSLYFLSLSNRQPAPLLWMRYSFFILLYPLGVTGEWLILTAPLTCCGQAALPQYRYFLVFLFITYAIGFPVLYRYMWKQRKSKIK
jgi:very-long-chain (3R)-3-hydroxyacyl-CoA dehydratase